MSKLNSVPVTDRNTQNNFDLLFKEVNLLKDSVNSKESSMGKGYTGKEGDVRIVESVEKDKLFQINTKNGWYTSFAEAFQPFTPGITPQLHLRFLEVDNLTAKRFVARQINAPNGDFIFSDSGEVESVVGNDIYIKNADNQNLCPFVANDLIATRRIKMDKSLEIKYIKATVSAVSGTKVTLTYTATDKFAKGDVVVRLGNSSDATRRDSVFISTNEANTPFIDVVDGISTWAGTGSNNWDYRTPRVRVGNLKGINAGYSHGVYIGSGGEFRINPSATVDGLSSFTTITSYGATAPTSPKTGDLWYDTTAGQIRLKRYNGATWDDVGKNGTYIDSGGIYTGTVVAQNITAGTGLVANLSVLSTLTMGSASTDGIIQSYGWNGTANGFQIKGGATPTVSLIGGTITGGTVQTATSGQRIVISGSTNDIRFYNSGGTLVGSIYGGAVPGSTDIGLLFSSESGTGLYFGGKCSFPNSIYSSWSYLLVDSSQNAYFNTLDIGSAKFTINSSGQITKINNTSITGVTQSYTWYAPDSLGGAQYTYTLGVTAGIVTTFTKV